MHRAEKMKIHSTHKTLSKCTIHSHSEQIPLHEWIIWWYFSVHENRCTHSAIQLSEHGWNQCTQSAAYSDFIWIYMIFVPGASHSCSAGSVWRCCIGRHFVAHFQIFYCCHCSRLSIFIAVIKIIYKNLLIVWQMIYVVEIQLISVAANRSTCWWRIWCLALTLKWKLWHLWGASLTIHHQSVPRFPTHKSTQKFFFFPAIWCGKISLRFELLSSRLSLLPLLSTSLRYCEVFFSSFMRLLNKFQFCHQ